MWRRHQVSSLDLLADAVLLLIEQLLLTLIDVPAVRLGERLFFSPEILVLLDGGTSPGRQ